MKKADNFNPGKWLVENKITFQSRLNENNLQENTNDKTYQIKYHTTKDGKKEVGFKTNKDKSFYWVSIGLEDITKKDLEKKGYKLVGNKITKQSRLNEDEYSDLDAAFLSSPKTAPYDKVLDIIKSYKNKKVLKSFTDTFPEGEPISKSKYWNWHIKSMAVDGTHIKKNWINVSSLNEVGFNQYGEPMGFDDEEEDFEDYEDFDIDAAFREAPNKAPYNDVLDIVKSYEDNGLLKSFMSSFPKGEPVSKAKYWNWNYKLIDDMSEVVYIKANWISMFDDDIFDKAGLAF